MMSLILLNSDQQNGRYKKKHYNYYSFSPAQTELYFVFLLLKTTEHLKNYIYVGGYTYSKVS